LDCLLQSIEFRNGILDGFHVMSGEYPNTIYTTSKNLADEMEVLISSLGKVSIIIEPERIVDKSFNGNNEMYCIRWCENKHNMNKDYYKIKSIEDITDSYDHDKVYCFEMLNKDNPYFTLPNGINTHNCRLSNDFSLLTGINSFGAGSAISIGSHRVVSINLPRIAIEHMKNNKKYNKEKFLNLVDVYMSEARDILYAHRCLLRKRSKEGFLKFSDPINLFNIDKHLFSTFGINGMHEMMYHITEGKLLGEDNQYLESVIKEEKDIISYINKKSMEFSHREKLPYNTEEVPGESLSEKFLKKDIIMFGKETSPFTIYSNQFVPLSMDVDILDRINLESVFCKSLSGGSIAHINMKSQLNSPDDMKKIILICIDKELEHFAINYCFNKCENEHVTTGSMEDEICPICGEKIVSRITRVVGYFTDTSSWGFVRREKEKRIFK